MKKLILTLLLAVMALLVGTTVLAAPVTDLTALAARVPDTAPFFVSIRTDQDFFETLDALAMSIAGKVGQPVPDDSPLEMLNETLTEASDGELNLETGVYAWLGDTVAVTLPLLETVRQSTDPTVFMFAVKDREAAQRFLEFQIRSGIESGAYSPNDRDGATFYLADSNFATSYILTDDVLFAGMTKRLLETLAMEVPAEPLSASEAFTSAAGALPGDDYSVFGYLNPGIVIDLVGLMEGQPDPEMGIEVDYAALADAVGTQAFGMTLLGDRALTFDAVVVNGSTTIFEALGFPAPTFVEGDALDPQFASNIPANALVYVQSSKSGSQSRALLNDLVTIGDPFLQKVIVPQLRSSEPQAARILGSFSLNSVRTFVDLMIEGTIGLTADELYGALDGQGASALFLVPDDTAYLNLETVQIYENLNPDTTDAAIAGIARLLGDFRADFSYDGSTITIPTTKAFAMIAGMMNPNAEIDAAGPDTLITQSDDLIAMGSRTQVEFALNPSADGLAAADAYSFDAQFFLPEAQSIAFLNLTALRALIAEGTQLATLIPAQDKAQLDAAFGLFDSAAITTRSADGISQVRMTLTLAK